MSTLTLPGVAKSDVLLDLTSDSDIVSYSYLTDDVDDNDKDDNDDDNEDDFNDNDKDDNDDDNNREDHFDDSDKDDDDDDDNNNDIDDDYDNSDSRPDVRHEEILDSSLSRDLNDPFYLGSNVTLFEAIIAIMEFSVNNKLTYNALSDLLKLLQILPTNYQKVFTNLKLCLINLNPALMTIKLASHNNT